MNDSLAFTEPTAGICVGVTFTGWKIGSGSGLSRVMASSRASNLLNLSDHFLSSSSILASAADLEDLETDDWEGLSELDFGVLEDLGLSSEDTFFFFLSTLELEPVDCSNPWSFTSPTTVTEDRSMRQELPESLVGVSLTFLD